MVRIYGSSDDLIEVDGDVNEEFTAPSDCSSENGGKGGVLVCSDGSFFNVIYNGCWRFLPLVRGSSEYSKVEALEEDGGTRADGTPEYSDVVTLSGDIKWVVVAEHHDTAKKGN